MANPSRFGCASSSLPLGALLRAPRWALRVFFVMGAAAHLSLMQMHGLEARTETAKPLTTQFVKRQPRLTKPLEMKKRPQPKQRQVQRRMVSVQAKASADQGRGVVPLSGTIRSLAQPRSRVERWAGLERETLEPAAVATAIEGEMMAKGTVNMALEMVDVEDLDTGQYHAMVIQDPVDKRNVRGFFRLTYAYSTRMRDRQEANAENRLLLGLHRLVERVNEYTDIKASFGGCITLDDKQLFRVPWFFIGSHRGFRLTHSESVNMGRYLSQGGFVLAEDGWPGLNKLWTPGYTALHQMLVDALETAGLTFKRDWFFELIRGHHPICHCFFDFDEPPRWYWYNRVNRGDEANFPVNGITLDGRLYAILDRRGYAHTWANLGPGGAFGSVGDPTLEFQFGVNLVVFALTQEGSITRRIMDTVE